MSITHNITVFPSGTLRACPANPTMPIQHSALPALTTDENTCYTCINTYAYNVCDPGFWNDHLTTCGGGLTAACRANPTDSACPQYDPTYSCYDGTNYWCDQSLHTHVGRNCSYKDPSNTWIFRDSLFTG